MSPSPFTSCMSFLLHLRWFWEDWSVGGEGGVIGGSGFEGGNKVGVGGGSSKTKTRRRLWVIVEIIVIWICIRLRLLIIVIVMLRLVFHAHAWVIVVIFVAFPCWWLIFKRVERCHLRCLMLDADTSPTLRSDHKSLSIFDDLQIPLLFMFHHRHKNTYYHSHSSQLLYFIILWYYYYYYYHCFQILYIYTFLLDLFFRWKFFLLPLFFKFYFSYT